MYIHLYMQARRGKSIKHCEMNLQSHIEKHLVATESFIVGIKFFFQKLINLK